MAAIFVGQIMRLVKHDQIGAHVRARLEAGLRNIAFFVVPSAVAFLMLGDDPDYSQSLVDGVLEKDPKNALATTVSRRAR